MIVRCNGEQKNEIIKYIGADYYKCIYLYMNLVKYGCDSENIAVYKSVSEDGNVTGVFLKYFNCLHIFGRNINMQDVVLLINETNPRVMFMTAQIKENLDDEIFSTYDVFKDMLFEAVEYDCTDDALELSEATLKDVDEIVEFLMKDEFYSSIYVKEALKKQLTERMEDGYSRSFVSRVDSKMVFHMATTAELPEFVMGGLGLLDASQRGKGLGKKMFGKFYNLMLSEGVKCYCFPADERAYNLHKGLGFKEKYSPIKLVKKA